MKLKMQILTALFAALTAAGAFVRIPFPLAAVTLQFLFTALSGMLLGAKWGAVSQAVYVLLGLAGLPVFALGGGVSYVLQPTFGYVLGLIPAAWVIGRLTRGCRTLWRALVAMVAGLGVLYAVGVPYLWMIANGLLRQDVPVWQIVCSGMLLYLPGDVLKIVLAAVLGCAVQKRLRGANAGI